MPMQDSDFARQLPEGPLAVAVSGGVDSLAALLLCLASGRRVFAIHARMWHGNSGDEARARECEKRLADTVLRLGCDFQLVDLGRRFEECVVQPFVQAWQKGLTPNPCALCNRRIKFGALWERAAELGAAALVTGHYASLDYNHPYRTRGPLLAQARDARKDQAYFLGLVPGDMLSRVAFPLSRYTKDDVRALVADSGLAVPQPAESQEICFVPDTPQGYRDFLGRYGLNMPPGDIMERDSGKKVGRHTGLWQYTEGQRHGLGIAWSEPLYVLEKEPSTNTLLVGGKRHTLITRARANNLNLMVDADEIPRNCLVRLRYRQRPVPAKVHVEGGEMHIHCQTPLSLSAPGQVAACYDEAGRLLGAGILQQLC